MPQTSHRRHTLGIILCLFLATNTCQASFFTQGNFWEAVEKNQIDTVQKMMNYWFGKPDVNKKKHGQTPLHFACSKGYFNMVQTLLQYHANPNLQNHLGRTPLHTSSAKGYDNITIAILNTKQPPLNVQDHGGFTALHHAASQGNANTTLALLQHSANANLQDHQQRTPLHYAAAQGYSHIVKVLVKRGASVNLQDKDGNTPLHLATSQQDPRSVGYLLEANADKTLRNTKGKTPLDLAQAASLPNPDIVARLAPKPPIAQQWHPSTIVGVTGGVMVLTAFRWHAKDSSQTTVDPMHSPKPANQHLNTHPKKTQTFKKYRRRRFSR